MTVETEVASLTSSVNKLTDAVNVQKSTLDASVASALQHKEGAETAISTANSVVAQAEAARDAAQTAQQSANSAVAYQDLTAIDESVSVTANDVFVYDTSKDSDGGAWRNRTQGTSWYNEALNTSVRGATKKFPAVAVIVIEDGVLTIHDGDDPSMPMWMVANVRQQDATTDEERITALSGSAGQNLKSVTALNGQLFITGYGGFSSQALLRWDFIGDRYGNHSSTEIWRGWTVGNIAGRNSLNRLISGSLGQIKNNYCNDVAVTVLPNAPISPTTGLPEPTIALGTDAGLSVIKDDGTVVDITADDYTLSVLNVKFLPDGKLYFSADSGTSDNQRVTYVQPIPYEDYEIDGLDWQNWSGNFERYIDIVGGSWTGDLIGHIHDGGITSIAVQDEDLVKTNGNGVQKISRREGDPSKGLQAVITHDYNTGWMAGDVKLATLATTASGTISTTELVTNGDFSNGTTGWTASQTSDSLQVVNGKLRVTEDGSADPNNARAYRGITTEIGKAYVVKASVDPVNAGSCGVHISPGTSTSSAIAYKTTQNAGDIEFSFTAQQASYNVLLVNNDANTAGSYSDFDNVSVTEAVADRTRDERHLTVNGNITVSEVASGSELMGFSNFGTNNYLELPHDSALSFGQGDFELSGWVDPSGDTYYTLFDKGYDGSVDRSFFLGVTTGSEHSRFYALIGNVGTGYNSNQHKVLSGVGWYHFVFQRKGDSIYFWLNGELDRVVTNNDIAVTSATSTKPLRIGTREDGQQQLTHGGQAALFKISGTPMTPEQIGKVYREEKALFQDNADCTLYGTTNACAACDYDEDTGLLHVGTYAGSSHDKGRSVFKGLQRVSNTTTQVTDSISAVNGLVAEE